MTACAYHGVCDVLGTQMILGVCIHHFMDKFTKWSIIPNMVYFLLEGLVYLLYYRNTTVQDKEGIFYHPFLKYLQNYSACWNSFRDFSSLSRGDKFVP